VTEARPPFHQPGLTGFRALAALWVLLFHLNSFVGPRAITLPFLGFDIPIHPLLTCGWVGVDLFFVLSGFLLGTHLIASLAARQPGALRRYFAARARRVFPAYWTQLAILFAVAVALAGTLPAWSRYLPLHIPMLHFVSEPASFSINNVYWTLPIEFAFYLCLPFVARILVRAEGGSRKWAVLLALYAGSLLLVWCYRYLAWRAFAASPVNTIVWATSQLPGSFDQFMAGVAAACVLRWQSGRAEALRRYSTALAAAGLAGVVGMIYFIDHIYLVYWQGHWALIVWHSITAAFVAIAVLGVALGGGFTRALFENRVALWIGLVSYSVYLWHYPMLRWLKPWLDAAGLGLAGYIAVALPAILAVSALSYYAVERPFMRHAAR
jgi:peptidoglycan/LPS O-acetylase OafA/YrhL